MGDDRGDKLCSPRLPGMKFVLCAKIINYVVEKVDCFILHLLRNIHNGISFMSSSLLLLSTLKRSLLKVYLTWVSNNLVLKEPEKKACWLYGMRIRAPFWLHIARNGKSWERQSVIVRAGVCFVKCEHNFKRHQKRYKKNYIIILPDFI